MQHIVITGRFAEAMLKLAIQPSLGYQCLKLHMSARYSYIDAVL